MCKVDTVIEQYGLSAPTSGYESLDEYLVARWTGSDGHESEGYQSLTTWFNKRVLTEVYEQHGRDTMSVRIESEYDVLTGDDDLQRDELAADLAIDGIDADDLRDELVSWSTMRRHLNDCLGGTKARQQSTTEWELDSVEFARDKAVEKASAALRSLASKNRLPEADKATVEVQVKVSCPQCPTRVPLEDALERGYICQDHFQQASPAERLSDAGARSLFPLGIAQLASLVFAEESFILADLLASGIVV